jgi:20S proteasome subunit alpha 6
LGFNGLPRGGAILRGGMADRGRGRGGSSSVPRGPAGMRRPDLPRPPVSVSRDKDKERSKRRKDRADKEWKTTMTDFRIVGIEMKDLGWKWGLTGDEIKEDVEEEVKEELVEVDGEKTTGVDDVNEEETPVAEQVNGEVVLPDAAETSVTEAPVEQIEGDSEADPEVKTEPDTKPDLEVSGESAEVVEEKRGEKRKAKTSSPDGGECTSFLNHVDPAQPRR